MNGLYHYTTESLERERMVTLNVGLSQWSTEQLQVEINRRKEAEKLAKEASKVKVICPVCDGASYGKGRCNLCHGAGTIKARTI